MNFSSEQWTAWYRKNAEGIREDFFHFLRFKSISTDSAYDAETRKTAEWLRSYLESIGMRSLLWETPGKPVVYAERLTASPHHPTLLIYHHYDVQPVDPLELWHSPPFEPVLSGHTVYARGASDNKGQCFYTITALRAFLELAKEAKINLKLFIEGEEESGSTGTFALLKQKRAELQADHLLVVDAGTPALGEPAVTVGVRGMMSTEVELQNAKIDLHSGSHGGIALNPNQALVTALAGLWDSDGKVLLPGFYEDLVSFPKEELEKIDLDFDEHTYRKQFGVRVFGGERGFTPAEARSIRPTLEINGVSGGYAGKGFKTVIPSSAKAKISCRLVANQDPEKIYQSLTAFFRERVPQGLEVRTHYYGGSRAFYSSVKEPIVTIAAEAYAAVFQRRCRFQLMGGSIPIVAPLREATGARVALIGVGLDSDDIHAPNEHFGLDRFEQGVYLIAHILTQHVEC